MNVGKLLFDIEKTFFSIPFLLTNEVDDCLTYDFMSTLTIDCIPTVVHGFTADYVFMNYII